MKHSESELIERFKRGDKSAADQLIGRYYERVVNAARKRLEGCRLRGTSEEDVAASVFESLWQKVNENRFGDEDLASSDELWKLLCTMVRYKARDHLRYDKAKKRGGHQLQGESVFMNLSGDSPEGIDNYTADDYSIASVVGFREQYQLMMDDLDDPVLAEIATMRLEGYRVKEIADHFERSDRWVKRKLSLIRSIWSARGETP